MFQTHQSPNPTFFQQQLIRKITNITDEFTISQILKGFEQSSEEYNRAISVPDMIKQHCTSKTDIKIYSKYSNN